MMSSKKAIQERIIVMFVFSDGVRAKAGLLGLQMVIDTNYRGNEEEDSLDDLHHIQHLESLGLFLLKRSRGQDKRKIRAMVNNFKNLVDL